jgi:hypothetical protein
MTCDYKSSEIDGLECPARAASSRGGRGSRRSRQTLPVLVVDLIAV